MRTNEEILILVGPGGVGEAFGVALPAQELLTVKQDHDQSRPYGAGNPHGFAGRDRHPIGSGLVLVDSASVDATEPGAFPATPIKHDPKRLSLRYQANIDFVGSLLALHDQLDVVGTDRNMRDLKQAAPDQGSGGESPVAAVAIVLRVDQGKEI